MSYRLFQKQINIPTQKISLFVLIFLGLLPSTVWASFSVDLYTINITNSICYLVDIVPEMSDSAASIIRENGYSRGGLTNSSLPYRYSKMQATWECGKKSVTFAVEISKNEGGAPFISNNVIKSDPGITAHFNFIANPVAHWNQPDGKVEIVLSNQ